jgi:uncharacterized protein YkwD
MAPTTTSLGLPTSQLVGTTETSRFRLTGAALRQSRFFASISQNDRSIASQADRIGNSLTKAYNLGNAADGLRFSDAVHSRDRDDIFRVKVGSSGRLNINVTGLSADIDVELINAKGSVVGRSNLRGLADERINQDLAAGQYFVRVRQFRGDSRYNLEVNLVPKTSEPATLPVPAPAPLIPAALIPAALIPAPLMPAPGTRPAPSQAQFTAEVLALTNQFRASQGLTALTLNQELNAAADRHSADMLNQDYFDHTGRNGSKPWDRAGALGYSASTIGENIAAGYGSAEAVVQGWINSPGHRANLLNFRYTEMGLGYSSSTQDTGTVNYGNYWTQMFGSGDTNPASLV